jgi:hypothetical protein
VGADFSQTLSAYEKSGLIGLAHLEKDQNPKRSFTVTVCCAVAELLAVSITVQVTTVTPFGNTIGESLAALATPHYPECTIF